MERVFLEHVYRWVRPAGALVLIAPFDRVTECQGVLTPQFREKAIYRLTEPEAVKYRQVVVFGIRRTRQERDRMTDHRVQQGNRRLHELTRRYEEIPPLPDSPDRVYAVPSSLPAKLEYRGLPLDVIEDLLEKSPAWLQAQRIRHAPKTEFSGRPLTPLHRGHVGILCTSGLLNGQFGEGNDTHVAYWETVKVVDRTEEEDDSGATVIREKERFSQRLTLLYADGRIALLSERAGKEAANGERAPADGETDVPQADRDTITDVSVHLNRLVAESPAESRLAADLHLVSVFGGDQETGAVTAAANEGLRFEIRAPGVRLYGTLGEKPIVYRSSLQIAGRNRPVRHVVLLSKTLFETKFGSNAEARRTVLYDDSAAFVLHRLAVRFGLPVLPEWAEWFRAELERRKLIEELIGVNCSPIAVKGTKLRLLRILSQGLRRQAIAIPTGNASLLGPFQAA